MSPSAVKDVTDLLTTIVAKVEPVGPDRLHMDWALPERTLRFLGAVPG